MEERTGLISCFAESDDTFLPTMLDKDEGILLLWGHFEELLLCPEHMVAGSLNRSRHTLQLLLLFFGADFPNALSSDALSTFCFNN